MTSAGTLAGRLLSPLEIARREVLTFERWWGKAWAIARLGAAAYEELRR